MCPAIFTKGNNFCDFLFASWIVQKWGQLLEDRYLLLALGAKSLLIELYPFEKGGKYESGRIASPENVPSTSRAAKCIVGLVHIGLGGYSEDQTLRL